MLQGSRLLSARGECAISCTGGVQDIESSIPLLARTLMCQVSIMAAIFRKKFPTRCNK